MAHLRRRLAQDEGDEGDEGNEGDEGDEGNEGTIEGREGAPAGTCLTLLAQRHAPQQAPSASISGTSLKVGRARLCVCIHDSEMVIGACFCLLRC